MALAQRVSQAFLGSSRPAVARVSAVRPAVSSRKLVAAPQALFGGLFGGSKQSDDKKGAAAPQSYICVDCGFIYPDDFKKAPGSYRCPVCNSPKSRFKVYKGPVKGKPNNTQSAMKQRMSAKQW